MPYTWRVGVDNRFGRLHGPGGTVLLCESVMFLGGEGEVVDLSTGSRRRVVADASLTWEDLRPDVACALTGYPGPELDAETGQRRVDPFHVERHASALWQRLVGLIYERSLPCGQSMRSFANGGSRPAQFLYAYDENPEVFAASVNLRCSVPGVAAGEAIRQLLALEAGRPSSDRAFSRLLRRSGWSVAIVALERRLELPAPGAASTRPPERHRRPAADFSPTAG
jgi:hypothetical protein